MPDRLHPDQVLALVIGTDVGHSVEQIKPQDEELLVTPKDVQALATAVMQPSTNAELRKALSTNMGDRL